MRVTNTGGALSELADFLNAITPELTEDQWEKWCQGLPYWLRERDGSGQSLKISIAEARAIRGEILKDLGAVWADRRFFPEAIDQDLAKRMEIPTSTLLGAFCYKLTQLQMKSEWSPRRVTKGGNVIQRGEKKERWTVDAIPVIEDIRTWLYHILAKAFESSSISRLKICSHPTCRKYFAAKDQRQRFCDDPCRHNFFNRRKYQPGESKKYRNLVREKKIKQAEKLRDAGISQEEVKATTKLPAREVRKIFAPRIYLYPQ